MNFPVLKTEEGEVIRPQNVMLHNQEKQMIFSDAQDPSKLFNFDLESGKIVEEFRAEKKGNAKSDVSNLVHITNKERNGQTQSEQTFVGINERAIYTLDPRINKKEKAAESKVYKTNPLFNKVATTINGGLAIGSLNGCIRLYKQVGQNAKTLLPGLGDPIRAIEMSVDGKWILATTQTYLLLLSTSCKGEKNGFEASMGKEKPVPVKLQLNVKDLAKHQIKSLDFTAAHFNNFSHSNKYHTGIVTSTGPFVVTWNLQRVLKGLRNQYQIIKVKEQQKLVDSQFQFDNDENILVTESKNLGVQTRSKKVFINY
uniref:Vacuolar import/degradation Vid27 C-terminal domain-containing protein n=1 Tax=Strombidium rassoulzadegani TaxID=1082188 RepID=A0A7S3CJU9_9SPIT|mmetsp:Transcript_12760/g.21543  ORF Transcript_12760/g.21543 Transcript_12760/m.21543 type:complete len:313 (+) Transcript_12760:1623-2561(+)